MQPMVTWLQGGGTGYEAVAWFVSINKHDDPNNLPLLRTMLFEYVAPPTSPSVLTTPGAYWANTYPTPASADKHAAMHASSLACRRCSMIVHPMRQVWPVGAGLALLVSLLALAGAGPAQAQPGPPVLPVCPETSSTYLLFPSPFFDEDQTMFWVYQDASRAGVLRSTDNGRTWFEVLSYSEDRRSPWINQFDIAPVRGGSGLALYAIVMVSSFPHVFHFFASENSGSTWQEGSSPCAKLDCYYYSLRAASRPGVLFQPRVWWSNYGTGLPEGVARSVDHGTTWQQVWAHTPVAQVAISPNFDQDETLVGVLPYGAQISNTNFILSHDAGETWHPGGGGLCPAYWLPQLTISPGFARDRTLLLVSNTSSLFMSEDAGLTWRAIFPPGGPWCNADTGYSLAYVAFSPDYPDDPTIYATTIHGLYASYDAGRSWILLVSNYSPTTLIVRRAPNAGRATPERTTQGDVRLTEDGHRVFLPLAAIQGSGPPYQPHTLFMRATIPGSYGGAHYRSDDGGRTWQCMNLPLVRPQVYLPLLRIRW